MRFSLKLVIFILSSSYAWAGRSAPKVTIGNTTLIGRRKSSDVEFFGGVPFAEPPVGNLRLRPPVLKSFTSERHAQEHPSIFNATQFGPACIQTGIPTDEISEDCLSVNIFRPAIPKSNGSALLPVMLWFYGGGFIIGSSSFYDGTPLVTRSISRNTPTIFVSANYRMGPLGYPRGDDAAQEAEEGSGILNLGLKDNLAAMQWVKDNIAYFGGDPNKVTVFGESAGALSLELLILDDEIRGLARGVIMESTGGVPFINASNPTANDVWNNFVMATPSCADTSSNTTVDCIRILSTSEIIEAYYTAGLFFNVSGVNWLPVLDGELVPAFPSTLEPQQGVVEAVLIGSNLDEGTLSTPQSINSSQPIKDLILSSPPSPPDASEAERAAQLNQLEHIAEKVLHLYPNNPSLGSPFGTGNETFGLDPEYKRYAAVSTDFLFQAQRRFLVQKQLLPANIPTYVYLFADPDAEPIQDFVIGTPAPGSLGVTHSSEVFYVFGNLAKVTPTALALSRIMMDYWISFANALSPNDDSGHNRPLWPEYTARHKNLIQLNGHNTTVIPDNFRAKQINFLNKDPAIFAH